MSNSFFSQFHPVVAAKREVFFSTSSKTSKFFNGNYKRYSRGNFGQFGFSQKRNPVNGITAGGRKFRIPRGSRAKGYPKRPISKDTSQNTNMSNYSDEDNLGSKPFSANRSNTSLTKNSTKSQKFRVPRVNKKKDRPIDLSNIEEVQGSSGNITSKKFSGAMEEEDLNK